MVIEGVNPGAARFAIRDISVRLLPIVGGMGRVERFFDLERELPGLLEGVTKIGSHYPPVLGVG